MKKTSFIALTILIALCNTIKAQVKIDFNGFSCEQETSDGSGSDEIYFIMNVFKDGVYQSTHKFPEKSYMGGVDAGGNYLVGSKTIYEGAAKNITVVIYGFEWDKGNPDEVKNKIEGYMRQKAGAQYGKLFMLDSAKGNYVIRHVNELVGNERYDWIENGAIYGGDDGIGVRAAIFPINLTKYPLVLREPYPKVRTPNKINYPYNLAVEIFPSQGNGKFKCYFSMDATHTEIDYLPIRYFWNNNGWMGNPIKMGLKNESEKKYIAFFENANVYSSKTGTFEVHGDILKEYSKNNGGNILFLGYPTSNEIDIKTSTNYSLLEWSKAGYLKYNSFENGYIMWKPTIIKTLTKEEFFAGPKNPLGSIKNTDAIKKDLPLVINSIDVLILQKGKEANLGAIHSESATPRPTAGSGGRFLRFERGWVYYNPNTKTAHAVYGDIMTKWGSLGYETGALGFPISDETDDNNFVGYTRVSKFEKGNLYYGPNKPVLVVMSQTKGKGH